MVESIGKQIAYILKYEISGWCLIKTKKSTQKSNQNKRLKIAITQVCPNVKSANSVCHQHDRAIYSQKLEN